MQSCDQLSMPGNRAAVVVDLSRSQSSAHSTDDQIASGITEQTIQALYGLTNESSNSLKKLRE